MGTYRPHSLTRLCGHQQRVLDDNERIFNLKTGNNMST